eukprot:gene20536-27326_t
MDIVSTYLELREGGKLEEAVAMLAEDAVFETPKGTIMGRDAILKALTGQRQESPTFEPLIEESPGVFVQMGKAKMMMMTFKIKRTITVVDGKIARIQIKKL